MTPLRSRRRRASNESLLRTVGGRSSGWSLLRTVLMAVSLRVLLLLGVDVGRLVLGVRADSERSDRGVPGADKIEL